MIKRLLFLLFSLSMGINTYGHGNHLYSSLDSFLLDDSSCTYTLLLQDSFGDGWNEAFLRITDITTGDYSNYTLSDGLSEYVMITLVNGHSYVMTWSSGYYDIECSFTLFDNSYNEFFTYQSTYEPWDPYHQTGQETIVFNFVALCTGETCPVPQNTRIINHTESSATLCWTIHDTTQYDYQVAYGFGSEPDSMSYFTVSDTIFILTGLIPDSTYNVFVRTICDSNIQSNWSWMTEVHTGYCIPLAFNGWNVHSITNVTFGVGEETVNNYEHPTSPLYYGNYTALTGAATIGDTLNIAVTFSGRLLATFIWVDWNNNYSFDTNELVALGEPVWDSEENSVHHLSFVVPYDQTPGYYRMRILSAANSEYEGYFLGYTSTINPCPTSPATETHDYTLHILNTNILHHIYLDSISHGSVYINGVQILNNEIAVPDSTTITINVSPDSCYILQHLIVNGDTVYPPYTMVVTGNVDIHASFVPSLPDLHVTQIINSTPVANNEMTVSWTVSNDGYVPTPIGVTWYDTIYLVQNADLRLFDPDDQRGFMLSVPNMQGLDIGESYTNTVTITIPPDMVGTYYLFVLTDQPDATAINFSENNGVVPDPYTPSLNGIPYHYMTAYVHRNGYGAVEEIVDNDNFFFKRINIATPPAADLIVTNVIAPTNYYSGTEINVVATIANQGEVATKSLGWLDALYYSHTDHYDSTAVLLKTVYHDALENGVLSVGASYQTTFSCSLPAPWHGETYMYVVTDASNSEFEYAGENNNTERTAMANVIMTPPADLVVCSVVTSSEISNRDSFAVVYNTMNAGLGKSDNNEWHDHVFLSTSPELPSTQLNVYGYSSGYSGYSYSNMPDSVDWCFLLGSNRQFISNGITAGTTITTEKKYTLPSFIDKSEQLYFIVIVDANNEVFEYDKEGNNVGHSGVVQATVYYPDFSITDIQAPDTMVSGHIIDLGFTLNNNGLLNHLNNLNLRVYYSTDSIFNPSTSTLLVSKNNYISSMVGYPSNLTLSAQFPNSIVDSNYYLFFFVNKDSIIAEYSIQNNMLRSGPYYICHRTLPDLVLCNVAFPDTLQAGEEATINFDIVNNGETVEGRVANIYNIPFHTALMADDSIWCPVQMQISPFPIGEMTLAVGDTMHFCQSVKVPPMVRDNINFTLRIDVNNRIQELDEENNQVTLSRHVLPTRFDLAVSNINAPSSYSTGDTVQITWATSIASPNSFGYDTIFYSTDATQYSQQRHWCENVNGDLWNCALYLSSDSILSSNDRLITKNRIHSIPADSIIYWTIRAIMPHSISGNLYFIAKADIEGKCFERNKGNNIMSVPVTANLVAQPNLTVTSFTIDDTLTQNQRY